MAARADLDAAIAATRFGLGARPGEIDAARADPRGWLKAQIRREGADEPEGDLPGTPDRMRTLVAFRDEVKGFKADYKAAVASAPTGAAARTPVAGPAGAMADDAPAKGATLPPDLKALRRTALAPMYREIGLEMLARTRLAATTPASFRERWTLFWANHFTVASAKLQSAVLTGPFEREAIRPNVFGRFGDLLLASSTHPGMLMYLDQERSAGPDSLAGRFRHMGLNENLAREILELHTVGADAGYTQADVTEFARALTGFSLGGEREAQDQQGRFLFRPQLHEPGARTVMGRRYGGDGPEPARRILADLAANPHTAQHVSLKLARHFVADDPPPALVARLRASWLSSGGDLAELARVLVDSPEAWTPDPVKLKTPNELIVSGYRAADAAPQDPAKEVVGPLTSFGQRPFSAPQPNGWSDVAADWAAPDAVVKRLTWAAAFSAYYAPKDLAPRQVAQAALGARLTSATLTAVGRAETRPEALTILIMSPEFQRR